MAKNRFKYQSVTIDNADFMWLNFSGESDKYANGKRFFTVALDTDLAMALQEDGWHVKPPRPSDNPDFEPRWTIRANLGNYSKVYTLEESPSGELHAVELPRDMWRIVDHVGVDFMDVVLVPAEYEYAGSTGVTTYVDSVYVKLRLTDLDRKYRTYDFTTTDEI